MELPEDEKTFLKEMVKATRQRPHVIKWVDRDGTERETTLTPAEAVRVNQIAHRLKISKGELLRQVAHIPVAR